MSELMLFAETPRAGKHGHRFLVPDRCVASDREVASFFMSDSCAISIGKNFIAVRRSADQDLGDGRLRTGKEILVLAGTDVGRMSKVELVTVVGELQEFLDRLEHLVTKEIDWNCQSRPDLTVVKRPELTDWLESLAPHRLPTINWRDGPQRLGSPSRLPPINRKKVASGEGMWLAVGGLLAVIMLGFVAGFSVDRLTKANSTTAPIVVQKDTDSAASSPPPCQPGCLHQLRRLRTSSLRRSFPTMVNHFQNDGSLLKK